MENYGANYDLRKLQMTILIIVDEIDRICKKNQIQYTIDGGSLLGAVRHGGYIPWDDDFDVSMTRDNYEKFISACEKDLKANFSLQTPENDSHYPNLFAKVLLKDTMLLENSASEAEYQKGIYVDIFPWDNIPPNKVISNIQRFKVYYYKRLLQRKEHIAIPDGSNAIKTMIFRVISFLSKFYTHELIVEKVTKELKRASTSEYVSCMIGYYGYKKTTMKKDIFSHVKNIKFENREYSAVENYDEMLTCIYGNYMELPPVEKRRTHNIIKLDFGPY